MQLEDLTLATFEPLTGDTFTIDATPTAVELVLAVAEAVGERPGGRDPFSLTFRGPREPLLAQAIYTLQHAVLGALEIFIVPNSQDADGTSYQAVFT